MMKSVEFSNIKGTIQAPSSKSMMQRAVAAALLAVGRSVLENPSLCDDSLAAIRVAKSLGAKIAVSEHQVIIDGGFNPDGSILDCGESGLCMRSFAPIAALSNIEISITGSGSLANRPMDMVELALLQLGAVCKTHDGFLPLTVRKLWAGGKAEIDCSTSSQLLTGLLLALPVIQNDTVLIVNNLKSSPYIDLTLSVIKSFGIEIENKQYKRFFIRGGQQYRPRDYIIEGDWSGAAFIFVAAAIAGEITVTNLNSNSFQADKKILEALKSAGADIEIKPREIRVRHNQLKAFDFDATQCPDLFPPLVALAANCSGITTLKGVSRLKYKESDRGTVLRDEFTKLGVKIEISGDDMQITGSKVTGGSVDPKHDHRIVMAAAILALRSTGVVKISGWQSISKSYNNFFRDLKQIGGKCYE